MYKHQKFKYFNDLPKDSAILHLDTLQNTAYTIQRDDIIELKISGRNDQTASDFNLKSGGYTNGQGVVPQYLVDVNGEINFFMLGKIKVEGLTTDQLAEKLSKMLIPYLTEPIVNVRLINFRFTVLGEVKSPGSYSIPNEKVSILQALGYAGDMTYLSQRSNVKVIRDSAGIRQIGFLDFSTKKVLSSPFYYLKRNDVVYVETNTRYRQVTEAYTRAALIVGILSSTIATIAIFSK